MGLEDAGAEKEGLLQLSSEQFLRGPVGGDAVRMIVNRHVRMTGSPIGRRPLAKAWPTVLRFNGPNPAGHPEASHRDRCGQHPDHTKVAQWLVCAAREQHATNCGSEAACQMLHG